MIDFYLLYVIICLYCRINLEMFNFNLTVMVKADTTKNISIFTVFCLLIANIFVFDTQAQESGNKMELPFNLPYDQIEPYDYPYLIPPPKMFGVGDLRMYEEQQKEDIPKLFYVVRPSTPNIYWKERTYDVYTGQGWLIQNINTQDKEKNAKSEKAPLKFDIYKFLKKGAYSLDLLTPFTNQSAIDKKSFRVLPDKKFDLKENVYGDNTFTIDVDTDSGMTYQADYYSPDFDIKKAGELKDVPKEVAEAYTQLPEKFPQKLKDIAQDLKKKSNGILSEQILDTYKFVQNNVEYDLKWGAGKNIPNDYDMALWTYENKKGICAHFATLFITLMRAQGISSRMAVGFAGGKIEGDNVYIYSSYAHGWAEIYLPNYGWVPIDPTKGAQGREDGQGIPAPDSPPEWSNGGNVNIDLKFTLDEELQKEKDQSKQQGSDNGSDQGGSGGNGDGQGGQGDNGGSQGGSGGSGSGGSSNFSGNLGQLSNLDEWFGSEDSAKLEEKYENWLKEQQKLTDNAVDGNGDTNKDNGENSENKDSEEKTEEEKRAEKDKGIVGEIKQAVSSIGKNYVKNGLEIIILAVIFLVAYFIYKKYARGESIDNKIEERIRSVNRFVNIDEVIGKVELLYEKKEYNTAIIYGYNELEDYIAYVFDVINDPALTAREFENLIAKVSLLKSLNVIIENFERAKYSSVDSEKDCSVFLSALHEIAASNKTKK